MGRRVTWALKNDSQPTVIVQNSPAKSPKIITVLSLRLAIRILRHYSAHLVGVRFEYLCLALLSTTISARGYGLRL